ncbi:MAG: class I SAM-dependent methyltransferase [Candidatus Hodarchaeales archaeon]|jgi:ubiquinone/menaquinone biosynthesis C-methylase UbiE
MVEIDPEGRELQTFLKYANLKDKKVLEVGCGDGRLTFQYAALTKHVIAIDPEIENIEKAKGKIPPELSSKLEFHVGRGENLLFDDESFDIVFYAYSLCCFTDGIEAMKKGLNEAWRVLKSEGGVLVDLQPFLHQPCKYNGGNILYLITRKPKDILQSWSAEKWSELERDARFAIKNVAVIEHKFNFVADEQITVNEYYTTLEDVLERFKGDLGENFLGNVSKQTMKEIRKMAEVMRTPKGILSQDNAIFTILEKIH